MLSLRLTSNFIGKVREKNMNGKIQQQTLLGKKKLKRGDNGFSLTDPHRPLVQGKV